MIAEATVARVRSFWASWAARGDETGAGIVWLGTDRFVAAPARLAGRLLEVGNFEELVRALEDEDIEPVGEARLAYADTRPSPSGDPIRVEPIADDDARLVALAARADPAEWSEASVGEPTPNRYGYAEGGELLAVVSTHDWYDTIAHLSVFTDASARGRGLAGRVALVAIAASLERHLIPQWRSRLGNDASARAADRLGFTPLGRQAYVRLRRI